MCPLLMMHKTCSINYGHLADLQKTLPTTDLNKKNFHLIKYLLATFIFSFLFNLYLFCIVKGAAGIRWPINVMSKNNLPAHAESHMSKQIKCLEHLLWTLPFIMSQWTSMIQCIYRARTIRWNLINEKKFSKAMYCIWWSKLYDEIQNNESQI